MPEQEQNTAPQQETGIFEPKPLDPKMRPLSSTQKIVRFCIFVGAVLLVGIVFALTRHPFMKPVRTFYKGMTAHSAEAMCDAFPAWLVNADVPDDTITVWQMCDTLLTAVGYNYGRESEFTVKFHGKREVEPERIVRIEAGIASTYGVAVDITKGYYVTVHVIVDDGSDEPATVTQYVRLYKINGRWVMLDVPSDTE